MHRPLHHLGGGGRGEGGHLGGWAGEGLTMAGVILVTLCSVARPGWAFLQWVATTRVKSAALLACSTAGQEVQKAAWPHTASTVMAVAEAVSRKAMAATSP